MFSVYALTAYSEAISYGQGVYPAAYCLYRISQVLKMNILLYFYIKQQYFNFRFTSKECYRVKVRSEPKSYPTWPQWVVSVWPYLPFSLEPLQELQVSQRSPSHIRYQI